MKLENFYDLANKTRKKIFNFIKSDEKYKRLYIALKDSILVLTDDLSTNFSIDDCHDLNINFLDVNSNKEH